MAEIRTRDVKIVFFLIFDSPNQKFDFFANYVNPLMATKNLQPYFYNSRV